jgi:WD40 repeat protein
MSALRWTAGVLLGLTALTASAQEKAPPRVDFYGDPLPEGAVARLGTVRWRGRLAWGLAFSGDGKFLAGGCSDRTARLWETATGREVIRCQGNGLGGVERVALSPDDAILATLDSDSAVHFWDVRTGKHLRQAEGPVKGHLGHLGSAFVFAFAPDGLTLYAGPGGSVRVIAVADGKTTDLPPLPERDLSLVAVAPDGVTGVSAGAGGRLVVWDLRNGKVLGTMAGPAHRQVLALASGGRRLAVAATYTDPVVIVYDVPAGKELCRCRGHLAVVTSLSFAPDGKSLVSGSADLTARLWDAESGKERWSYRSSRVNFGWVTVVFAPDGKTVGASGWDGLVRLLDAESGKERVPLSGHLGYVTRLTVSPDGRSVFTGSEDNSLRQWDLSSGKEVRTLKAPGIDVYDREKRQFVSAHEEVYRLDLTPDGMKLIASHDRGIRMCDLSDPDRPRLVEPALEEDAFGALSPDGKRLAVFVWKRGRLWLRDGRTIKLLRDAPAPPCRCLCFSPDGNTLAIGCQWGVTLLYDVRTWSVRGGVHEPDQRNVEWVCFSPDGQLLATCQGGGHIHVWEVASGQLRRRIVIERSRLGAAAFSPDGRYLAVAGTERGLFVHDLATGRIVHTFQGHDGGILCLAFSPDGRRLVSASEDTTALVWDMQAVSTPPFRPVDRTGEELDVLWRRLAGDAEAADAAMRELAACPAQTAELLAGSLEPWDRELSRRIADWVRDLDNDDDETRERAGAALTEAGADAEEALHAGLSRAPSPQTRQRIEELLVRLLEQPPSAQRLRYLRAVQLLEWLGTPEARRILETLAAGAPEAERTRAAASALARLGKR